MIDSLNGYLSAMPEERFLIIQLHEACCPTWHSKGVITVLVMAQTGLIGPMHNQIDVSYLADSVLLLRFFFETQRRGPPGPFGR